MADQLEPAEIEALVDELQRKLDRLRILYEQYFIGIEKREPLVPLKEVVRLIRLLETQQIRNSALRYRNRGLVQKFNSYRTYWRRTTRAIDAGTYHRDVARMRRRMEQRGVSMPAMGKLRSAGALERELARAASAASSPQPTVADPAPEASQVRGASSEALRAQVQAQALQSVPSATGVERALPALVAGEEDELPPPIPLDELAPSSSARPTAGAPGPTARAPVKAPGPTARAPAGAPGPTARAPGQPTAPPRKGQPVIAGPTGLSQTQLESLHRRLLKAKQICGEGDARSVKIDSLKRTIERQLPKLRELHKGREIEFQVVVREGRAILKAKPR